MKPSQALPIGYVDHEGTIKKAKVVTVHSDTFVTLDHSDKGDGAHVSQSYFNADKETPNTWHFLSEGNGAGAEKPAAKK